MMNAEPIGIVLSDILYELPKRTKQLPPTVQNPQACLSDNQDNAIARIIAVVFIKLIFLNFSLIEFKFEFMFPTFSAIHFTSGEQQRDILLPIRGRYRAF